MHVHVLGTVEADVGGRRIALGGGKPRALLAMLALHAGETVSADRLIEGLWGEETPATAAKTLQVYVSQLRKALAAAGGEGEIVTHGHGYVLGIRDDECDAQRFERLVADGAPREALALWRGPALADVTEPFAAPEARRLEERRLDALEMAIDADLAAGRHAEVVAELEALVAAHPLREGLHRQRMLALYRAGRQAEALEAYREARRVLVDEIGIEPGPELRSLHEAILRQDPALEGRTPPRRAEPAVRRTFVGRERELAELAGAGGRPRAPADAAPDRWRAGDRQEPPRRQASSLAAARGRGCYGAAAGRRAAPRPTGRGRRPCAPTCATWIRRTSAGFSGRARPTSRRCCRSSTACSRSCRRRRRSIPTVRASGSSTLSSLPPGGERARPLTVVVDDLHAADAPSMLLLRFLAHELRDARIVIIATYRDAESAPGRSAERDRRRAAREPIARLSGSGVSTVPEVATLHRARSPTRRRRRARDRDPRRDRGQPAFVTELSGCSRGGRLEEAAGAPWGRAPAGDARGDRASPAAPLARLRRLLTRPRSSAGSSGSTCSSRQRALAATSCSTFSTRPWPPACSPTCRARRPVRFSHALIRDSLYERARPPGAHAAPPPRGRGARARLRPRARAAPRRARPPLLRGRARGDVGKAIDTRGKPRAAAALLAYEEAARHYEMALDALALSRTDEAPRCELLLGLGRRAGPREATPPRGRRRSPGPPTLRASSTRRSSSPVPRSGTAGDSCGSAPAATGA